jgi:hypothetical protein
MFPGTHRKRGSGSGSTCRRPEGNGVGLWQGVRPRGTGVSAAAPGRGGRVAVVAGVSGHFRMMNSLPTAPPGSPSTDSPVGETRFGPVHFAALFADPLIPWA